jgi:hypothetical protein
MTKRPTNLEIRPTQPTAQSSKGEKTMFKKLFAPVIVVLALLAGYAAFRGVAAQARPSAISKISSFTNLSTGDVDRAKALAHSPASPALIKDFTNLSTGDVAYAGRMAAIHDWTNLSTGDIARANRFVVSDWSNLSTGDVERARLYMVTDWTNLATGDLQYAQP